MIRSSTTFLSTSAKKWFTGKVVFFRNAIAGEPTPRAQQEEYFPEKEASVKWQGRDRAINLQFPCHRNGNAMVVTLVMEGEVSGILCLQQCLSLASCGSCKKQNPQREVVIPSEHTTCCCQFIRTPPCVPRRTHHFNQAISAVIVWRVARRFRSLLICVGELFHIVA